MKRLLSEIVEGLDTAIKVGLSLLVIFLWLRFPPRVTLLLSLIGAISSGAVAALWQTNEISAIVRETNEPKEPEDTGKRGRSRQTYRGRGRSPHSRINRNRS